MNVPIGETGDRKIDVRTWPEGIDEHGYMCFPSEDPPNKQSLENEIQPDVVVFTTGYTRAFPFLDIDYPDVVHANVRGVYKKDEVSLGFIGFIRPSIGKTPTKAKSWFINRI